jgi:hypothetical protein
MFSTDALFPSIFDLSLIESTGVEPIDMGGERGDFIVIL